MSIFSDEEVLVLRIDKFFQTIHFKDPLLTEYNLDTKSSQNYEEFTDCIDSGHQHFTNSTGNIWELESRQKAAQNSHFPGWPKWKENQSIR